jgi:hypothetical protein
MSADRPWYQEPETFVAVAALIVSVSAVAVGLYEASLQRAHDRAEVWPHVEVGTFTTPTDATVYLENTGVGPAVVNSIVVTVDGKPRRNWEDVVTALFGDEAPARFGHETVLDHSLRAGDKVVVLDFSTASIPEFWDHIRRVGITVCYASVFGDHWELDAPRLGGGKLKWTPVARCDAQPAASAF